MGISHASPRVSAKTASPQPCPALPGHHPNGSQGPLVVRWNFCLRFLHGSLVNASLGQSSLLLNSSSLSSCTMSSKKEPPHCDWLILCLVGSGSQDRGYGVKALF